MVVKCFKNILALLFKCLLFCSFCFLVISLSPSCFQKALDFIEFEVLATFLVEVKSVIDSLVDNAMNFVDDKLSLLLDDAADIFIVDSFMNLALHHCGARVVFNVPLPSSFWHLQMFSKPLLSKILNCVVVSIGHEILDADGLSMRFQPVHQPCAISFDLLRCWDRKEYDFRKSLWVEWSEDAPTHYQFFVWWIRCFLLGQFASDDHCLVLSVHCQADDVVARHSRQLLGDNVFQINEIAHWAKLLIIFDNNELNFARIFLLFNLGITLEISLVRL